MKDEELFKAWKSEQYKDQSTEERLEFVEHLHTFPKYFEKTFLAGIKAGRPQWHYVKDGDYPDTDRTVLAYSDDVVSGHYPYFAQYYKGFTNAKKKGVDLNWNCWRNNMQRELIEPTVWCEIPTFDKE